jgi:hypothetical protein
MKEFTIYMDYCTRGSTTIHKVYNSAAVLASVAMQEPTAFSQSGNPTSEPTQEPTVVPRTNEIYVSCMPVSGRVYSDATDSIIVPSSQGNSHILVVYDYDSNTIFAEPMPSGTGLQHTKAYSRMHTLLASCGLTPKWMKMDNKASILLKDLLHKKSVEFQLVPPHYIGAMLLNILFAPLKITSSQDFVLSTLISLCICGTGCYHKRYLHATCSMVPMSAPT